MDEGQAKVAQALANRRLSTRDKRLRDRLMEIPPSLGDPGELTPANIAELGREIDRYRPGDPRRLVLEQELARLRDMAGNLMPMSARPPEVVPGFQHPVMRDIPMLPADPVSDTPGGLRPWDTINAQRPGVFNLRRGNPQGPATIMLGGQRG